MPSPFPGMDPYLEASHMWEDVHKNITIAIQHQLAPLLRPRYIAAVEPKVTYDDEIIIAAPRKIKPDVGVYGVKEVQLEYQTATIAAAPLVVETTFAWEVNLYTIEVRTVAEGDLVTSIEILSPVNKRRGHDAFEAYRNKRAALLKSSVHLLEIDLLRAGERWLSGDALPDAPYFIFLNREQRRFQVEVWPLYFQEAIPIVPVPLREPDADVPLDIGKVLREIYDLAAYDLRIDYSEPPPKPALSEKDAGYIERLLRETKPR